MVKRYYCNGFKTDTYNGCCRLHDNAYGFRGIVERYDAQGRPVYRTRAEADRIMRECLIEEGLHPVWAWMAWAAVRAFGWLAWKKKTPE